MASPKTTRAQQITSARERASSENLSITSRGTYPASGQRFWVVLNPSKGTQYTVVEFGMALQCTCLAGQHDNLCKHRIYVHDILVQEREQEREQSAQPETVAEPVDPSLIWLEEQRRWASMSKQERMDWLLTHQDDGKCLSCSHAALLGSDYCWTCEQERAKRRNPDW